MNVREYLSKKGFVWSEVSRNGGVNGVMNCPFCDDNEKKFAINLETGAFKCFHENKCGESGSWWQFQQKLGDQPLRLSSENNFVNTKTKKSFEVPKNVVGQKPSGNVLKYLRDRGFSEATIAKFNIMQEGDSTVLFPYYKNGKLVNVFYRDIYEKKKMRVWRGAELCLFNQDNVAGNELIITEGQYDAMAIHQYGIDIGVVSIPSGVSNNDWIENDFDFLERFSRIYLMFDNDDAGQNAVAEVVRRLGSWRCLSVKLPKKDANECLVSGVPVDDILISIANAKEFPPSTLSSPLQFQDKIIELFTNPDVLNGMPTAWSELNKALGGWREGEVTIWTGKESAGKSTMLNQHWIDCIVKRFPCCIASLEMPPHRYLRWAVMQHLRNNNPSPEQIKSSIQFMSSGLMVVDTVKSIDWKELLDIYEYAARRYGTKHFIIDSLMKLRFPGKDLNAEQTEFMQSISDFAKVHKCHFHLVAHLRKSNSDNDMQGRVDVMGTSNISKLADNVILIFRPEEDDVHADFDTLLCLKKNREMGTTKKIKMVFNQQAKIFTCKSELEENLARRANG